ncbi:HAMP domain-containing protein [candidate division KSB1 bacterium]|nr:HAMP domain-containing protein [candidate division KSB1 bacterium]
MNTDGSTNIGIMGFMKSGLTRKFILPMAGIILVIRIVATIMISNTQSSNIRETLNRRGQGLVDAISGIGAEFIINQDLTSLEAIVDNLTNQDDVIWAVFYDTNKRPLTKKQIHGDEKNSLIFSQKIYDKGSEVGTLELALSTLAMKSALSNLQILMAVTTFIVILVTVGVLAWLFRVLVTKPLREFIDISWLVAKGDYSHEIEIDQTDEIGELAEALRQMIIDLKDGSVSINSAFSKVRTVVEELKRVAEQLQNGNMDQRARAGDAEGIYKELVDSFNASIDNFSKPLKEASNVLERLARKDLTSRMSGYYLGEYSRLKEALNTAIDNLDSSLQQVAVLSGQVTSASAQIGNSSQIVADGASSQASALQQISSSLKEVANMTKRNTQNTLETKQLSEEAQSATSEGMTNMQQLSSVMDKIKQSADETGKVIKTIDDIAFQTNLLALNAAVEAARAGEAGKGFAVVAEEVRNLAMRSADAAKNTAHLIEGSVKNAEDGVRVNEIVLKNLQEIHQKVQSVNSVMDEIAGASELQSQGLEQISSGIEQMNEVTQRTAANSEESASAAEELDSQAEKMRSMVASFVLSENVNGDVIYETESENFAY